MFQPVTLGISQASSPVSNSFIQGSVSAPLLGINLQAGTTGDVKVSSVKLTGYCDSGLSGAFTKGTDGACVVSNMVGDAKLFDGTSQVGTTMSLGVDGTVVFDNLNFTIPAGQAKALTLKGTLASSIDGLGSGWRLKFAVASMGDVTAADANGTAANESGAVDNYGTSDIGTRITITSGGRMAFSLAPDDTSSQAGFVIGGDPGAVLGKIRLTASNEELQQTKLRIQLVTPANYINFASMSLYDGSTMVAGPVGVSPSGTADFTGANFIVPNGASKTLTVRGSLNAIAGGVVSGADLAVMVDLTNPAAGTFEYRGTSSSTVVSTINASDITGHSKLVVKTKPYFALASLPTSIVGNGGGIVLNRFTVTADAGENVSLKKLSFSVSVNGTATETVSAPAVREVGQGSDIASSTASVDTTGGTNCGFTTSSQLACVRVVFSSEQVISAGTSKTYELRMSTANFTASGDSVSTSILGDTTGSVGKLTANALGVDGSVTGSSGEYNFIWSDNSKAPHADSAGGSADWMSGAYVNYLPTDTQTMTRS